MATPPSATGACALCHLTGGSLNLSSASKAIGANWDFVFRPDLYFSSGSGAVPKGLMQHYVFVPTSIRAKPGEIVTVYNNDQLLHRIVADDGSFDTGLMHPGASFTVKAGDAGSAIGYHCTLHSRMRGEIVVDPLPAVTAVVLNPSSLRTGGSYSAVFSGASLTNQTYFDVKYRTPGGTIDLEILNWQRGTTATHPVVTGTLIGTCTITGVRAHQDRADHTAAYSAVTATLAVTP